MADDKILRRLTRARTKLILDKPFLGALVLRMPLTEADGAWCKTTGTDAKNLYYNPEYIDALNDAQLQFALAHEVLHCAFSHFSRRGHRDRRRWDVACDYAINWILHEDGFQPVPGALVEDTFKGMTAEEIYPSIENSDEDEPHDQHFYDQQPNDNREGVTGSNRRPPPLSAREREDLERQWQQRLAGAAQQALQAGKLSEALKRLVDQVLQPTLPWRAVLARFLNQTARDDYAWHRPSSRREGPAIFPSLRSAQTSLVVAVDTSGSISAHEIAEFISEIHALQGQIKGRITLLACDTQLARGAPWIYESWEEPRLLVELSGGGGTAFTPVFDWVARQDMQPDVLLYFTDGEADFPSKPPYYPVIWLIKGNNDVPWGQRIQLN